MSLLKKMQSAKNYLMIFGAVAIIGLSSCEKDDDNPTNTGGNVTIGGAFVTTSGSYWVYEKKEIDTNGVVASTSIGLDSTVAGSTYTLDGKTTAIDFTSFPSNETGGWSMEGSKETYAKEGNVVYISTNQILGGMGDDFPIDFGDLSNIDKWIIAMQDKSSWDMIEIPINMAEFALPGLELPAKMQLVGKLKMSGSKVGTENLTIEGKSHSAMKFAMTVNITANLQLAEQYFLFPKNTNVAEIKFPNITNIYIVDGVGIVKTETMPSSTSITIASALEAFASAAGFTSTVTKNPGEVSTLIRHQIK